MTSFLLRLFTHEVPKWQLALSLVIVHLLIYLYLTLFNGSLLTPLALTGLMLLGYRMIVPLKDDSPAEWLSEDTCKALYKTLYLILNRSSGYFRSAVELKGGFKAVAKAVAFLYLSIAFKFLGDKIALYLGKLSITNFSVGILAFFLYTPISKKIQASKNPEEDKKA